MTCPLGQHDPLLPVHQHELVVHDPITPQRNLEDRDARPPQPFHNKALAAEELVLP